jgi:hypothetical protein
MTPGMIFFIHLAAGLGILALCVGILGRHAPRPGKH